MDWVRADDPDRTEREPHLHPEITVLVEARQDGLEFGDPPEMRPELRRLDDYPEVEEAWLEYLGGEPAPRLDRTDTNVALVAFHNPETAPIRPRIASQPRLVGSWGRASVQTQ